MKKLLLLTKMLLAAALLCVGQNAWGQVASWTNTSEASYTAEQELSSNTSVVSIKLGNATWTNWENSNGVFVNDGTYRTPTFTDGIPTTGGYLVIAPARKLNLSLNAWCSGSNANVVMIEGSNPGTELKNFRKKQNQTLDFGTLETGKTYYIYGRTFAGTTWMDFIGFKSFTATTYENYTIHFKDGEGNTIKADVVHEGLLGASVSAGGSDLDVIVYNEKTYAYSSGNTPITLTTGANEITLVYAVIGVHDYTVNAVAGGSTLKELASGSAGETTKYSVSSLPLVIKKDSKYYTLTDEDVSGYTKTFTMGTSDVEETVEYTLDESIAYFAEGEELYSGQRTASADCSNGAYTYYLSGLTSTFPLSAGWYRMETVVKDRANKNPLNIYLEDGTQLGTIAKGGSTGFRQTDMFKIDATSNVKIGLTDPSNKNSLSFDYVLVRSLPIPLTVSATIGSYEYATFSSTYPVNVDVTGLEAYIATGISGDDITMEKVTGNVAANTGLVLKGAANTYSLPVVASGTSYSETNKLFALDGTFANVKVADTGTNYVMVVQNDEVVWAPVTDGDHLAPAPAGHAALWLDGGSARSMGMSFVGDITAVENVDAAPAEAKAKDGKFIENGKLVIVKNGAKYNAAGAKLY